MSARKEWIRLGDIFFEGDTPKGTKGHIPVGAKRTQFKVVLESGNIETCFEQSVAEAQKGEIYKIEIQRIR